MNASKPIFYADNASIENTKNSRDRHCRIGKVTIKHQGLPPQRVFPMRFDKYEWITDGAGRMMPWWDSITCGGSSPVVPPHGVLM